MGHRQQYSALGIGRAAIILIIRKVCFLSLDTNDNNVCAAKLISLNLLHFPCICIVDL